MARPYAAPMIASFIIFRILSITSAQDSHLGSARVVFQNQLRRHRIRTVDHIFKLVRLGCYDTNHFFRVDKGFVAQVAGVVGGRTVEAGKTVVGEFSDVKHVTDMMIQTVLNPLSLCYLEMLLTLMANMQYLEKLPKVTIH